MAARSKAFLIKQIQFKIFDPVKCELSKDNYPSLLECYKVICDKIKDYEDDGEEIPNFEIVIGREITGEFRILQTVSGIIEDATYRFFKSAHII